MSYCINKDIPDKKVTIHRKSCYHATRARETGKRCEDGRWYYGIPTLEAAESKATLLSVDDTWSVSKDCYCLQKWETQP